MRCSGGTVAKRSLALVARIAETNGSNNMSITITIMCMVDGLVVVVRL